MVQWQHGLGTGSPKSLAKASGVSECIPSVMRLHSFAIVDEITHESMDNADHMTQAWHMFSAENPDLHLENDIIMN